jgi:hypothetical protein
LPTEVPLTANAFYETLPIADHRTGDIWYGLPTFGNLGRQNAYGIVITPACDLANRKCETITYLPIISADDYLGSPAFRFECWQEITALLSRLPNFQDVRQPSRYELIDEADLRGLIDVKRDNNGKNLQEPELARLSAYLEYVQAAKMQRATASHLRRFIKIEKMTNYLEKLVTNALKNDIHFLPNDGKPISYSAVPSHSVVLFRYPLTVPITILDAAQNLSEGEWNQYLAKGKTTDAVLGSFSNWPIKLTTLRNEFLSDLLSRYINMYIRLGSSDFSDQSVEDMSRQIGV